MLSILTELLLFILPFIVLPIGSLPFETSKVIVGELGIEALLLVTFFRREFTKALLRTPQYYLLAGLFFSSLSSLLFYNSPTTFFGNPFRLQGLFLYWHLLVFCFICSQIKAIKLPTLFYLGVLLTLLVSTIVLGTDQNGRAVATLGEANSLAAVAVFLWPFLWFAQSTSNIPRKIIKTVSIIIPLIVILLSGSRSGVLAFILQISFLVAVVKFKLSAKMLVPACLVLVVISLSLPFTENGGVFQNRVQIWKTALVAGTIKPIFGNGFGNIEQVMPIASHLIGNNIQYEYVDSSHNFLLDFWVEGGFFSLLLLILLIRQAFKVFIDQSKILEMMVLLGLIEVMMFNPSSAVVLMYFWYILGKGVVKLPS